MPIVLLAILSATAPLLLTSIQPESSGAAPEVERAAEYEDARALLDALAERDRSVSSLTGDVRYTVIKALENDRQMRFGKLAIQNAMGEVSEGSSDDRLYAVSFDTLEIDQRSEEIAEHYIFDGRWFVERLPEEKQFNKRELVPAGQTLDPMELMRDAPFWVSLGRDQDRLLASYDAEVLPRTEGLVENPDFPELRFFTDLPHVVDTTQLLLTPKVGSGFEDDWEWVRIWINNQTLLPALYIKSEWTGDLQIVELFGTETNTEIPAGVFSTATPPQGSGWRVQISPWRGDRDRPDAGEEGNTQD